MLAGRRQLSLDETGRRRLRRQSSEVRPVIAWQGSFRDSTEKQPSQVEVVAKKIGQPKPTPARPLRSPSIKNESCLTLSRRQVAERLKVGWNKAISKEGQDKGRQNLNIFLNQSFEGRPGSPCALELENGFGRPHSLYNANDEESNSDSSTETDSDDGTTRKREDPLPRAVSQQSAPVAATAQSASARRAVFKAAGRQRPTTCSPEPRLMSAPPQRARSAPARRRPQRRPRRGVEGGEVVTMVSLVSPAESEEEEAPQRPVQCPPSPPTVPPTPSPTPPPVLSLRRPPKAVTFKSSIAEGPQYCTSYPTKSPTILQGDKIAEEVTPKMKNPPSTTNIQQRQLVQKIGKPQNTLPSKPKPTVLYRQVIRRAVEKQERTVEAKKPVVAKVTEPIQEEIPEKVNEMESLKLDEEVAKADPTAEETGTETEDSPDFKSPKERECWHLFKRMSSRGVSVSFETVLRGLLTPTEYRMRRAALMASC